VTTTTANKSEALSHTMKKKQRKTIKSAVVNEKADRIWKSYTKCSKSGLKVK